MCAMQDKIQVQGMLDKASEKVKDLITLEVKLEKAIETKRSKLAEKDPDYTASGEFRNEDAGVRITCATHHQLWVIFLIFSIQSPRENYDQQARIVLSIRLSESVAINLPAFETGVLTKPANILKHSPSIMCIFCTQTPPVCRRGKDGKPTFERTGTVGGDPSMPTPRDEDRESNKTAPSGFQDPWRSSQRYTSSSDTQYSAFRQRRQQDDVIRKPYPEGGYVPSVECASACSALFPFCYKAES